MLLLLLCECLCALNCSNGRGPGTVGSYAVPKRKIVDPHPIIIGAIDHPSLILWNYFEYDIQQSSKSLKLALRLP